MHLSVDIPKARAASSNDGNTEHFQNSELSSLITGLDKELIDSVYFIPQSISSGFEIDNEAYN